MTGTRKSAIQPVVFDMPMMRDTHMAEHKHGEMNIEVQEKTFERFVKASAYVGAGCILFLIFLAMVNS